MFDESPIPIGIVDEHGDHIYRMPWRDTVPMGFHHQYYYYEDEEDGDE